MAEGVLLSLTSQIASKARSLAQQEIPLRQALKDDIEGLKDTAGSIQGVLLDAENNYLMSNEVKGSLDSLKDIFYDAEDLLDDISADVLMRQLKPGNVGLFFTHNWMVFASRFANRIKEIREKLGCIIRDDVIRFLSTITEESERQRFDVEEFSILYPEINIVETIISYNHLPSNYRQCFAYCSLFPKGYIFDVPRLISYWRAQGYIDAENGEEGGLDCFENLLQRSFFQVKAVNEDGEIEKCGMHDFMHDLATFVAGEEIKLVNGDTDVTAITGKTRHIFLHEKPDDAQWQDLAPLFERKKIRTLIVHPECHKLDDRQLQDIVYKLTYSRVLVLQDGGFEKFPSYNDGLKLLRQLDLSGNEKIKVLPDSITELHYLEDLFLDNCTELEKLPTDMKRLTNLIHLGLERCLKLEGMPRGIGQLASLVMLSQFSLSQQKNCARLDELQSLNKLKGKLRISNLQYANIECRAANLRNRPSLRSLALNWGTHEVEYRRREEESLQALKPHLNLRELEVVGERFPEWVSSLRNLVTVTIVRCSNCQSLLPVVGLPSLQHLSVRMLKRLEYIIDNTGRTTGSPFFPSLKTLTLWECPKLKGWLKSTLTEVSPYRLPYLSELVISGCPVLPCRIPQLPSLHSLISEDTSIQLVKEIVKQATPPSTGASLPPLQALSIGGIQNFEYVPVENLSSLKSLVIKGVADTSVVSPWLKDLTSLESLSISNFNKTKTPPKGISFLTSLTKLVIEDCRELESLPPWMRELTSLEHLQIYGCTRLTARSWSELGRDWPSISHIANIKIDNRLVQHNGRYL